MIFRCVPRTSWPGGGPAVPGEGTRQEIVVDLHCHRESAPAMEMMQAAAQSVGRAPLGFGSQVTRDVNRQQRLDIAPKMQSIEERLADMDRAGVDVQVVSLSPYQLYYWAEPELGREVARVANDDLAVAISAYSDRILGMGTVPLQDTKLAVEELERCVLELGFRAVELATNVEGEELSDVRLEPFWTRVEELGVVVFLHSAGFTHPDRFEEHYFINIIGHPLETTLAAAHLIFDGVMERHPALKMVLPHGGGYLPAYAARMDHAYHARRDVREGLPRPPGEYLKRFYFDTVVFEADQLAFLIEKYGADHIVLGSDYPYDMGDPDPVGVIARVEGLSGSEAAAIRGGNARRLLGLDAP